MSMTPGGAPPKARRILGALGNNTPARRKLVNDVIHRDEVDRLFNSPENGSPSSPPQSPVKMQSQLLTGDLASACAIM